MHHTPKEFRHFRLDCVSCHPSNCIPPHAPLTANSPGIAGPAATALETRVHELEKELRRVEQERDILKKALAIFSQKT